MTTLIDTAIPAEDYLEQVLRHDALEGRTEEAFVAVFLSGINATLSEKPELYRSYGPWWPEIKRLMIERELNAKFGENIDEGVSQIYSLSRPALTLIAAHLYSAERIEAGYIYSAHHELTVHDDAEDTEPYLHVSDDEEMEKLIAVRG